MKAAMIKHGECFELALEAESLSEGSQIADFGINVTKDLRSITPFVSQDGIALSVVIGKRREGRSVIGGVR